MKSIDLMILQEGRLELVEDCEACIESVGTDIQIWIGCDVDILLCDLLPLSIALVRIM